LKLLTVDTQTVLYPACSTPTTS